MRCPLCGEDNIPGVDQCADCGSDLAGLDLPEAGDGVPGRLLRDRLEGLELSPPLAVSPETSVADTVAEMRARRTGCALVVEDGRLVGVFNEHHLVSRVLVPGVDATKTPVSGVMSPDPLRLGPEDPPAFAVHCMVTRDFRHLPVVSEDRTLGVVSVRNILAYLHRHVTAA
ncbi:MAG: CBS domain-containing protein [Thermoanaerobaculia bacterium]|nr:CBS domain-containing protein [Thermoanaerobaculia bacterium]